MKAIALAVILIVGSCRLSAQTADTTHHVCPGTESTEMTTTKPRGWLTLALGVAGNHDVGVLGGSIGASLQTGPHLFTLRYLGGASLNVYPACFSPTERLKDLNEFSGLYGYPVQFSVFRGSLSGGLGVVALTLEDGSVSRVIGMPVDLQISVVPLPVLGLGVQITGNLNSTASFWAVFACAQIGRVR
jgi:hypothetical protein